MAEVQTGNSITPPAPKLEPGPAKHGVLVLVTLLLIGMTGCALRPTWHWEKPGADEQDLNWDQNQCKAKTYSGNDGNVTNASVRRMFACMEGKGWSKRDN